MLVSFIDGFGDLVFFSGGSMVGLFLVVCGFRSVRLCWGSGGLGVGVVER